MKMTCLMRTVAERQVVGGRVPPDGIARAGRSVRGLGKRGRQRWHGLRVRGRGGGHVHVGAVCGVIRRRPVGWRVQAASTSPARRRSMRLDPYGGRALRAPREARLPRACPGPSSRPFHRRPSSDQSSRRSRGTSRRFRSSHAWPHPSSCLRLEARSGSRCSLHALACRNLPRRLRPRTPRCRS
jgi:hypothetical protein